MEWRPRNKRLFVFSVPEKNKIKGSSLYQPKANRGFHTQTQECWILSAANDCQVNWKRGQKVYIHDGFELEPVDLDLWSEYQNDPAFASLKAFVAEVEGKVRTEIIAEGSILATEGDVCA